MVNESNKFGIYIDGKLIATGTSCDLPYGVTEVTTEKSVPLTFEGLYVQDDSPMVAELEYTTRRKGKVYFRSVGDPKIKIWCDDPECYEAFNDVKRGTIITGTITYTS